MAATDPKIPPAPKPPAPKPPAKLPKTPPPGFAIPEKRGGFFARWR